jgi:hypothetical protein
MPQRPQHEPGDEADLSRWFKTLGPPPQGRAAPHLRASVLAQIAQRRARRGLWAWLPPWRPAVWVPVLAMAFVLSLAVNIWWGIDRRGADPPLSPTEARPVHAYRFLHAIRSPTAIGSLVASHTAVEAQFVALGFALQDPRVIIFRMGILYTDALAALHSGTLDIATRRVYALGKALDSLPNFFDSICSRRSRGIVRPSLTMRPISRRRRTWAVPCSCGGCVPLAACAMPMCTKQSPHSSVLWSVLPTSRHCSIISPWPCSMWTSCHTLGRISPRRARSPRTMRPRPSIWPTSPRRKNAMPRRNSISVTMRS